VKTLKSDLAEALAFAAIQNPIDLIETAKMVDDQIRMAISIDLAIGQVKVEYLGYVTKELQRQMS
jgi:hypothetical protein